MISRSGIYSEQRTKEERLRYLKNVVIDGRDAEKVLRYAEILKKNIEEETLEKLSKPSANIEESVIFYRLALAFVDLLKAAVEEGKRKEATYEELRKL